ncbi:hypothetical protein HYV89_00665 [Candidatus Woesearchaeota archaeon]|nr:hypothetical protein [Candidatus Woesearchaeota archaeon]
MPIHFLSPNPEQKEAFDELEKLLGILDQKPSKDLIRNARFIRKFTKAMLLAGKKSSPSSRFKTQYLKRGQASPIIMERKVIPEKPQAQPQKIPAVQSMPLPPPPPSPAPMLFQAEQGINIKGGGKSFNSFVQKVSKEEGILRFSIIEPEMESVDWKIFNEVKAKLKQQIIKDPGVLDKESYLIDEIKDVCKKINAKYSDSYLRKIRYYLVKYIKGFGKVDPLIKDPDVSEIICSSYNNIKVRYKSELIPTNIQFDTNEELDNFIINLAEKSNKKISEIQPDLQMVFNNLKISAFYNPIMGSRFTIAKQ